MNRSAEWWSRARGSVPPEAAVASAALLVTMLCSGATARAAASNRNAKTTAPDRRDEATAETETGDGSTWAFEAAGGATLLGGVGASAGGDLRIGFRRRVPYDGDSFCDRSSLYAIIPMILSGGLACVPGHVWYGNDRGLDLRVRAFAPLGAAEGGPAVFAVGLSPALGVSALDGGRHRLPSVLQVFLPEIGVTAGAGVDPAVYLEVARVPYTFWLTRRIGLEARAGLWIGRPPWDPDGSFDTFAFSGSLGLAFRSDSAPVH